MKYILSRYNHDAGWVKYYTKDPIIYDRSEEPMEGSIVVPNIGTDIYDKFTYIIDNYDNLPEVMCLTKANLFKYITQTEFDEVKDNKKFTPLLLGLEGKEYLAFAPGSNYIVTKKNILKHPKEHYEKLRSYLTWGIYPGEAQLIERGLYYLWQ